MPGRAQPAQCDAIDRMGPKKIVLVFLYRPAARPMTTLWPPHQAVGQITLGAQTYWVTSKERKPGLRPPLSRTRPLGGRWEYNWQVRMKSSSVRFDESLPTLSAASRVTGPSIGPIGRLQFHIDAYRASVPLIAHRASRPALLRAIRNLRTSSFQIGDMSPPRRGSAAWFLSYPWRKTLRAARRSTWLSRPSPSRCACLRAQARRRSGIRGGTPVCRYCRNDLLFGVPAACSLLSGSRVCGKVPIARLFMR